MRLPHVWWVLGVDGQSLHHAQHPEKALSEASRILRKGGQLVVLDLKEHQFSKARQLYGDQWLAFSDDDDDKTDPDTVADLANVKDQKVQPSVGVLEDYCRVHMRMGVSEIKPIVLVRILDLSRLFRCVSAQGFVEMLVGKGVNSLFGFERLVVHKPVEFTLAITSMLNGWKSQRLHPPRFSLFTELLRLLGIHPKRSSRFLWREELQSVLDATRNQHGHFLMSGEYVFSLAQMRQNCLRLRRRIRHPEI